MNTTLTRLATAATLALALIACATLMHIGTPLTSHELFASHSTTET